VLEATTAKEQMTVAPPTTDDVAYEVPSVGVEEITVVDARTIILEVSISSGVKSVRVLVVLEDVDVTRKLNVDKDVITRLPVPERDTDTKRLIP